MVMAVSGKFAKSFTLGQASLYRLQLPAIRKAAKRAYPRATLHSARQFHLRSLVREARPVETEASDKSLAVYG
jgi:hypothetical protein